MRSVLAVLVFGFVLAAEIGAATPDIIRFATVNANYRLALEEIIRRYEQRHPHLEVELSIIGQEFATWIRTRVAAGGDLVPDIYNGNYTNGYAQQGRWVVLDPYFKAENPYTGKPWIDGLDGKLIERYRLDGKSYTLPIDYIDIAVFYNRDLFAQLGLVEPETWQEWLELCQQVERAGYVPIAVGGDAESYWAGEMGWLVRLLGDAYLRNLVPLLMARPGDWDYQAGRNKNYSYQPTDLYSDMLVVLNREREFQAISDGQVDFAGVKFRRVYQRLNELAQYFQPGYMGTDGRSALQLFYRQKAAMCLLHSGSITGIIHDFAKMKPDERFDFANFWFPPIVDDPLVEGPFRGVGGGGMVLAVMQKDDLAHERNVVDFLQFLTSPEAGRLLVEMTLADGQSLTGPLLIDGVELPDELADKFAVFKGHGYEKINYRGLRDEQESVQEWVVIAQEYMGGRLQLDEFLQRYGKLMQRAVVRQVERDGIDMDPSTEDAPPIVRRQKNHWNPFVNGSLMLVLLLVAFGVFAVVQVARSRGPARHRARTAYALLLPTVFLLIAFNYYPALSGLYHAFTEWESGRDPVFNGLDNFRRLLQDEMLYVGFGNMLILLGAALIKATVVPFLAAQLILYLLSDRVRYLFRTAFLLPMVVPAMVGVLIWRLIYNPEMGLLNQSLQLVGLDGLTANWLGDPVLALGAIIGMGFPWIGAFGLLIYLAGLMAIPSDIYDAYATEASNTLRRIWSLDIPLVNGQTRMLIILTFIGSVQDFQTVLIMTRGGPAMATYVPALRMYNQAFVYGHFGYGAAIGLVLFAIVLAITAINMKVIKETEAV
ncbi:MAG: extracellular solute-binding protein [Candidatus Latescibacteria bacterium]|nr:extracellular solute-binding protein [Candidatus Latescibacterota bacterium]